MHPGSVVYSPSSCFHYSGNIFKRWDLLNFQIVSRGMWQGATSFDSLKIRPEWALPVSRREKLCTGGSVGEKMCPFTAGIQPGLSLAASRVSPILMTVISSTDPLNENTIFLLSASFLSHLSPNITIRESLILSLEELESTYWGKKCNCRLMPASQSL